MGWKKLVIDGHVVEFPEETVNEVVDTLEKARRKKEEKKRDLEGLLDVIRRRLREVGVEEKEVLEKAKGKDLEERRKALKEREEKYGYKAGKNAHLTKPKEYRDVPDSQFADPVGYNYPVNTPKRARAALAYFIRFHDQYDDPEAKLFIYERILRALKKFGIKRHFDPDWPGDWLVPKDLKEWMEGYDKYEDKDTEEMREKMLRRWGKKSEKRRLIKQAYAVFPTVGSPAVASEENLANLQRDLVKNLGDQMEELIGKVLTPVLSEFLEDLVEEMKTFHEKVMEVFDTVIESFKESSSEMAEAVRDAAEEIKGAVGVSEEFEAGKVEETPVEETPAPEETPEVPAEVTPEEVTEETPEGELGRILRSPFGGEAKGEEKEEGIKAQLRKDLMKTWEEIYEGKEEEEELPFTGIIVDLKEGEFLGGEELLDDAETHVRFHDPETGRVSKKLKKDKK